MSRLLIPLTTASAWVSLVVATFTCAPLMLLALAVAGRAGGAAVVRLWARWWLIGSGVQVRAEVPGELGEYLEPGRAVIFLANHVSWYDIPALVVSAPVSVSFLAKKSLFRIPVFGWGLRLAGGIPVDRGDAASAVGSLGRARASLAAGRSMAIFPEGTRSWDGELAELRRGAFLLAAKSGAAVVPVGIVGTFRIMPRGRMRVRSGPVVVRYGQALVPDGEVREWRRELPRRVAAKIRELAW